MGEYQERRFVPRGGVDGLGLGAARGSHAVSGVTGAVAQVGRRLLIGLCVGVLVALAFIRPPEAPAKAIGTAAVLLAVLGLVRLWRQLAARLGLSRCYLFAGGLVVTGPLGRVRAVVPWTEVTSLHQMSTQSLLMAFHRVELVRRGARTLALVILGLDPALVPALLAQAAENGIS